MSQENKLEGIQVLLSETSIPYKNYNLLFLSQVYIIEHYTGWLSARSAANVVKKAGLENVVKLILFRIKSLLATNKNITCDYLFVNEVNNKPVIETLSCVEDRFDMKNTIELISDQRLLMAGKHQLNIFQFANLAVMARTFLAIVLLIPELLKKRKELKVISKRFKINRVLLIFNFFDSVFLVNVLENCFAKVKTKKVVLISDVHKMSRIISIYSKSHHIQTFVLQHGATIASYGYLPVISDKILVWGELSKKWFVERGTDKNKILITGSPRMDKVRPDVRVSEKNSDIKFVLIVMSEVLYEGHFLELIRDAFVKLNIRDVEISVKLHPAGPIDYSYMVHDIFSGSELKYRVIRNYDLKKLLVECNLVFVTTSSAGMEAIIFNKPVFQFKIERFSYIKMSYEDYDCTHLFNNSHDIFQIVSDRGLLFSKIQNYANFVEDYFYKLDGKSSLRAKSIIENH